ncbi:MAG TPA: hypothetical protein VME44_28415 [Streptosporangiaceae bacterium]|nr:hypothetical protein [Streptosporangiaceae bacterium]
MSPRVPGPEARMHATAAALAGAGLAAQVNQTQGAFDITASVGQPDGKSIEVTIDEDGYVQVSYWNVLGTTPAQMVAVIAAVVAAITAAQPGQPARAPGSPQ